MALHLFFRLPNLFNCSTKLRSTMKRLSDLRPSDKMSSLSGSVQGVSSTFVLMSYYFKGPWKLEEAMNTMSAGAFY